MKVKSLLLAGLLMTAMTSFAAEPERVNEKESTEDATQAKLVKNTPKQFGQKESVPTTDEYMTFDKYRIGGYGEMVAAFKDYGINRFYGNSEGNTKTHRNTISIPRFVLAGDYKFSRRWVLGVEIEFEGGGTGSEYEIENTENGEYETETEKGGEVALEQFHITNLINRAFNIRVGHMIVPVGLNNEHHEPLNFFGTVRPEGETTIIPNTWHETGLEFFGQFGKGYSSFNYEAMVVEGLNANGFDRNHWVGEGKQGIFEEDNFTSPGYVARLNYNGIKGLRVGASFYYCGNAAKNSDKLDTYTFKVPVTLWSADAQYIDKYVTARFNYLSGNIGNSAQLSAKNAKQSSASPYNRTGPIAKQAVSVGGEIGLNIKGLCNADSNMPEILPFIRYEYFNAQQKGEATQAMDPRLRTSEWIAGLNWRPLPNLVVKADYTWRAIGNSTNKYNSENEFALGVAWAGWFHKK